MDIARPNVAREKRRKRIIYAVLAVAALLLVTLGLSKLKPAPPSMDRSSAVIDTVHRGDFMRQVHGIGSLVVEDVRWIPAITEGRVDKIDVLLPGTDVKPDTILLELSNPQLQQETLDAEWKMKAAEADYHNLEVQLQSQHLAQKADTAKANQDSVEADMKAKTDKELARLGVISDQSLQVSQGQAQQLAIRSEIERQRLDNTMKLTEAQLAAKKAEVEEFRALYELKKQQLDALKVRAGAKAVLQEMPMKVGQWVTPGTTLAKLVQPERLKAQLNVAETQAKDVLRGQPVSIDTHNGIIAGKVANINPTAQNGTVTIDVMLQGTVPGARPDLSVDGTIDLEHLTNVLYTGRPAFGQEGGNLPVSMFKLDPDGKTASRIQVRLGRSSVTAVEILDGLKEGDQVILSDMSRWDKFDRVKLD